MTLVPSSPHGSILHMPMFLASSGEQTKMRDLWAVGPGVQEFEAGGEEIERGRLSSKTTQHDESL